MDAGSGEALSGALEDIKLEVDHRGSPLQDAFNSTAQCPESSSEQDQQGQQGQQGQQDQQQQRESQPAVPPVSQPRCHCGAPLFVTSSGNAICMRCCSRLAKSVAGSGMVQSIQVFDEVIPSSTFQDAQVQGNIEMFEGRCHSCNTIMRFPYGCRHISCHSCGAVSGFSFPEPLKQLRCPQCSRMVPYRENMKVVKCSCGCTMQTPAPTKSVKCPGCSEVIGIATDAELAKCSKCSSTMRNPFYEPRASVMQCAKCQTVLTYDGKSEKVKCGECGSVMLNPRYKRRVTCYKCGLTFLNVRHQETVQCLGCDAWMRDPTLVSSPDACHGQVTTSGDSSSGSSAQQVELENGTVREPMSIEEGVKSDTARQSLSVHQGWKSGVSGESSLKQEGLEGGTEEKASLPLKQHKPSAVLDDKQNTVLSGEWAVHSERESSSHHRSDSTHPVAGEMVLSGIQADEEPSSSKTEGQSQPIRRLPLGRLPPLRARPSVSSTVQK